MLRLGCNVNASGSITTTIGASLEKAVLRILGSNKILQTLTINQLDKLIKSYKYKNIIYK